MSRQELYKQGYFFLRKRHTTSRARLWSIAKEWSLYISEEFGKWNLVEKFDTEEEVDWEIEQYVANYPNCIVE